MIIEKAYKKSKGFYRNFYIRTIFDFSAFFQLENTKPVLCTKKMKLKKMILKNAI